MKTIGTYWIEAVSKNDCYAFLREDAKKAAQGAAAAVPGASALLSDEAFTDLENDYIVRCGSVFMQLILSSMRNHVKNIDIYEYISLRGENKAAIDEACSAVREELLRDGGRAVREKYSLAAEYEASLRSDYISSKAEFLGRVSENRDEISSLMPGGRGISKILRLSPDGADLHRHGRSVTGVTTDAGTFFYKPHNCSLDAFYHEIVGKWFSDITKAPAVIDRNSYAFVSALEHSEVSSMDGIRRFWSNFGALTALFHALGSTDMHSENIMSCGEYPCAVDLETILRCIPGDRIKNSTAPKFSPAEDFIHSALSCGSFPVRMHIGGIFSPMYTNAENGKCLPVFEGRTFTVSGYEDALADGFREGYARVLCHRDDIMPALMEHAGGTIRIVPRNTMYYSIMRNRLLIPEALSDTAVRDDVIRQLRIPYEIYGQKTDEAVVDYEEKCLLRGDIPYYCTGIDTTSLCGEDTGHEVRNDYFALTAVELLKKRLERLSGREEAFEEELIRLSLKHAPLDETSVSDEKYEADGESVTAEELTEELGAMLSELGSDMLHHTDGMSVSWQSTVMAVEQASSCGLLTAWADVLMLCGLIRKAPVPEEMKDRSEKLAGHCLRGMRLFTEHLKGIDDLSTDFPAGLGTGLGGALLATGCWAGSGEAEACGIMSSIQELLPLLTKHDGRYSDSERGTCSPWNVMNGFAGLVIALALTGADAPTEFISRLSDEILEGLPAEKIDGPEGAAGMGAALAYAYSVTGDERYEKGCESAFEQLRSSYSEYNKGWTGQTKPGGWAAGRKPLSAGIALAAQYSARLTGSDVVREVLAYAAESISDQKELFARDSLNNGNALLALALMMLSRDHPEMKKKAGGVLRAMIKRKENRGTYTVFPEGVRSSFDPALALGTAGIGCVMAAYLSIL